MLNAHVIRREVTKRKPTDRLDDNRFIAKYSHHKLYMIASEKPAERPDDRKFILLMVLLRRRSIT